MHRDKISIDEIERILISQLLTKRKLGVDCPLTIALENDDHE